MASALLKAESWYGCYAGGRGDLFCPESNRHPAKMAVGLCYKILHHGLERGYWNVGDCLLDPMAGICTVGICAASLGLRSVNVELEAHFVALAEKNIELLMSKMPQAPRPLLIQGDARRLRELLAGADGAVTSPPYSSEFREQHPGTKGGKVAQEFERGRSFRGYSGAVTSPPYSDQAVVQGAGVTHRILKIARERGMAAAVEAYRRDVMDTQKAHGRWSDANIQRHIEMALATAATGGYGAAISSPPYAESISSNKGTFDPKRFVKAGGPNSQANIPSRYSKGERQIGNLRDPRGDIDGVLSSPPYGDVMSTAEARGKPSSGWIEDKGIPHNKYGNEEAQIGNKNVETYLSAMLSVYRELHAVLKPAGVVCLVTKNPVKAGKVRRLDEDTMRLMEAAGFALLERKMAMLTEELGEQGRLDGGTDKIRRERKSFFKRLFERKRPDLAVDHEDVLFFRKV